MELTRHPLSMMVALQPAFCASMAQAMPVGPAPTTQTSLQESGRACACERGSVSGICWTGKGVRPLSSWDARPNILAPYATRTNAARLLLHANRNSIADGQDGRKQILRLADEFVEFEDGFGLGVGVGLPQLAAPENVVCDKKAAAFQARKR